MADYKILLGTQLDTSDIVSQINEAERKIDPIKIKVDAETKELTKSIQDALKSLSKGTNSALTLDTSKFEGSIADVKGDITEIKTLLNSLGSGTNMRGLVSSIGQISTALDKASGKFDELSADLKALSSKDFSVNIGVKLGGSNSVANNAAYGDFVKSEVLPALKKQEQELSKYLAKYYNTNEFNAINQLLSKSGHNIGGVAGVIETLDRLESPLKKGESLKDRMRDFKNFINMITSSANIQGVDLSPVLSQFEKLPNELIESADKIRDGTKQVDDSVDKLKQVFGSGIEVEQLSAQLEPIISDLNQIREAIQNLSKGASLEGLTSSFDRLSGAIEKLLTNAEKVKGVLNSGFDGSKVGNTSTPPSSDSAIKSAQQTGQKIGETITKSAQQSTNLDDVIDKQVLDLMNKFSIAGDKGSKAFDEIKQAVVECRTELTKIKNSDIGIDEEVFDTSRAVDKVTDAIANQHRAANQLGDEYVKLAKKIEETNNRKKGYKIQIPEFVKQEQGDDYRSNRGSLGAAFTTGKGTSFADFIDQINNELGQTIDLTKGEAEAFDELLRKVELGRKQKDALQKSNKYLTSTASTEEILEQNGINRNEIYDDVMSIVSVVDAAEQKITQSSTEMANEVAQSGEKIERTCRETSGVIENLKTTLETMRVDRSSIDAIVKDVEELGFTAKNTSVEMKNGKFDITVNGVDEIGRAITEIRRFDSATDEISLVGRKISQPLTESDKFIKQQKKSVADLTNQINQLNRSAIDPNASRPIKDTSHLDALSSKYDEITRAIQRMENASSDTFIDEQNNVRKLISEYKSLVSEYKNAENVSTKMKGTDFGSGLDIAKNDLEKFKAEARDFPQITATVKELDKAIEGVGDAASLNKFNDQLRVARSELAKVKSETTALNRSEKVGINVSGLESKIADIQRISPEIDKFETEIDGAKVSVQSLLNDLKQVKTQGDFSVVNARFRSFKEAAQAAGIAVAETAQKARSINDIKIKLSDSGFNGFEQEVKRAHAASEELEGVYSELEVALKRLDVAMEGVYSADQAGDVKRLVVANEEYEASLKQVYSQLKLNQQAEEKAYKAEILSQKKSALGSEMETWLKENSRAAKDFGEEIRRLQASLNGLDDKGVKLVGQQFKSIQKQAQAMGKTGLTAFDQLKTKAKEYMTYLSAAEMFMYAEQALRSMFEQVKLIDSAMTELKKVTDETDASYDRFLSNAATRSREIGTTIDGLVSSTADFARLGYGFEDAQGLAEVANIYAVVGDEINGVEGATESLISTMAAFKDEMNGMSNTDFAMSIVDIFNELGNKFAISSGGLGEAFERSASSLAAANNTIHESAALITAANTVVQDPAQVGTAFKTISMRIKIHCPQ